MEQTLLSVCIITYNHENYIREAIEGVLMQIVDFEYEIIIADDFSTDNTRKVILEYVEKYPNLFTLIFQKRNVGAAQNWVDLLSYPKSKYIAYLEGDDYWTDSCKLQKQIDFLVNNQDYGMVSTNSLQYNQSTGNYIRLNSMTRNKVIIVEDLLFEKNIVYSLTVCFRACIFQDFLKDNKYLLAKWKMGDLPLWLYVCSKSKIFYLNDVTAVYRLLTSSASNSNIIKFNIEFIKSSFNIKYYFLINYFPSYYWLNKKLYSFFLYQCLVANVKYNGNFLDFISMLKKFYIKNNQLKYFVGSFLQVYKKIQFSIKPVRFNRDKLLTY